MSNSGGICDNCHQRFYTITDTKEIYSSDYKSVDISFVVTPVNSSVKITGSSYTIEGNYNIKNGTSNITQNTDGSATIKYHLNFNEAKATAVTWPTWRYDNIVVDGQASYVFEYLPPIWMDHTAPVVTEIKQTDQKTHNDYATIKQLDISGTEDYANAIKLSIIDKETGKKLVDKATAAVTDNKWSYTCTPPLEASDSGRTYIVQVEDVNSNSTSKEFTIYKTDGTSPQIESPLSYTDWTNTAKTITLTFTDYGSGDVQASLDNQTSYKACIKTADGKYQITYTFSDDIIGNKTYKLYLRDGLGNAGSYDLVVGNIDKNTYNINYRLNGGTMSGQKTSYTVADSFTLPQPTRTGYAFTGWTGSNGTTPQKTVTVNKGARGNLSYTANWSANQYTISYDANGGTGTMDTDTATYNENYVTKTNQFTRTGYEFIGWTENADGTGGKWTSWIGKPWKWTYTKNITLYAQWEAKTYTITYEPNGGIGVRYTQTAAYDTYFKTAKNQFTRTGYTFAGFSDLNGHVGSYAKLIKKSLLNDVLKNPWHLSKIDSEYRFYNYTDKVWETYCLIYWEGPYNVSYGCSPSNFTMSARWKANNYTVTLDYKKSISSSYEKTIVATYDSAYGKLPQPVLPGWTFKGWNTKADGTGATVTEDTVYKTAGDSILYAQWSYDPVSVKVPQMLMGDHTGRSQFRVKCDDMKAGSIKITVPESVPYKQAGKTDVTAAITAKSGNNTITPTNKVCVYDITTKSGLTAGCWQGNFNIGLTLTKE